MTASAPVSFTVTATLTTTVLQRDLNGYAGASDTYLDASAPTAVRGASTEMDLDPTTYRPLVRFAIFQSEGGPVPNGAVIQSATLALYKQYYNDTLQLNALLKPWVESQATWTVSQTGVPWAVGGAAGAGTDYSTTTDALVAARLEPGLGQLRRNRAFAPMGGRRRHQQRLDSDADDQWRQYEVLQFERVHHRHHAATQAHGRLFRRHVERSADGQHHDADRGCGGHARPELHAHRQRERYRRHGHQGRLLRQRSADRNGHHVTVYGWCGPRGPPAAIRSPPSPPTTASPRRRPPRSA